MNNCVRALASGDHLLDLSLHVRITTTPSNLQIDEWQGRVREREREERGKKRERG
jgi:hypothetical protein